jgi:hypothetical protein
VRLREQLMDEEYRVVVGRCGRGIGQDKATLEKAAEQNKAHARQSVDFRENLRSDLIYVCSSNLSTTRRF